MTATTRRKRGMARFEPTQAQRDAVLELARVMCPHESIAACIISPRTGEPITAKTLRANFVPELKSGRASALAMLASTAFSRAIEGVKTQTRKGRIVVHGKPPSDEMLKLLVRTHLARESTDWKVPDENDGFTLEATSTTTAPAADGGDEHENKLTVTYVKARPDGVDTDT